MADAAGVETIEARSAAPASAESAAADRRRIAVNFLAVSLSSGLAVLIGILTTAYSRRMLGPVVIGQVNWNAAVLAHVGLIANPGLQIVGQRDIAADRTRTATLASLILSLQAVLAVVAYGVVVLIAVVNPRGAQVSLLLLLQGVTLLAGAGSVAWVLQAHERMVAPSIASLVISLLQIPVLIAIIHGPEDVFAFVLYTVPFVVALTAYNFWYINRHGVLRLGALRWRLAGARRLLAEAWPLALSQGAVLLIYNCGAIILGFTHDDAEVGLYTTAYKLMMVSTVISGAMLTAYFPVLARARGGPPGEAARVAREFMTLLAWMGLPVAALGWACGRHVNDLMFGSDFVRGGPYFEWLCLNIGLVFVNIGIGTPLLAWGYQKLHFKITAIAGIANLALNLILIPSHGGWGAIAATLAAELMALVMILVMRQRLDIGRHPIVSVVAPPLLCAAAVALAIVMLPPALDRYWWAELALGTVVLGGCVLVFERRIATAALSLLKRAA
ncbi:flippase [Vineibacter terrae]|uniref:flippase n=1 Tax=Vineibacter terrae TaxID=2586908 RepID=UPI0015B6159F|nr:flippase [Vineibacter terrae]